MDLTDTDRIYSMLTVLALALFTYRPELGFTHAQQNAAMFAASQSLLSTMPEPYRSQLAQALGVL